jgi:hypothetical protein
MYQGNKPLQLMVLAEGRSLLQLPTLSFLSETAHDGILHTQKIETDGWGKSSIHRSTCHVIQYFQML